MSTGICSGLGDRSVPVGLLWHGFAVAPSAGRHGRPGRPGRGRGGREIGLAAWSGSAYAGCAAIVSGPDSLTAAVVGLNAGRRVGTGAPFFLGTSPSLLIGISGLVVNGLESRRVGLHRGRAGDGHGFTPGLATGARARRARNAGWLRLGSSGAGAQHESTDMSSVVPADPQGRRGSG